MAAAGTLGVSQTGQPLVAAGRAEFAFRLLNAVSFASSILALVSATLTLMSIANRASYVPITFFAAFISYALAVTAALGGAMTGVLAFLSQSGGIAIVGIVIVSIVICCAVILCGMYFCGENNKSIIRGQELNGPPNFSLLAQAAAAAARPTHVPTDVP